MSWYNVKSIHKLIILALTVMMSITVVGCSVKSPVTEQSKLTDEKIKQEIIVPMHTSDLLWSSWDNGEQIEVYGLANFLASKLMLNNDIDKYDHLDTGQYTIPQDVFENELKKNFNVSEEYLRSWFEDNEDMKYYSWCGSAWVDDFYNNSDEIDEYKNRIKINNVTRENGNTVIDFDIDSSYDFVKSYKLTVDDSKDDIKLLSLKVTDKDYYSLCVGMNIVGIDFEFEKSTDLNSEQLFDYAMFIISDEEIEKENWDKWIGEYESGEWTGDGIPLSIIENTLTMRLGEYNFNPEETDYYDKENKVFRCMIGGYGGVRFPQLREKTMEGDILTLVIDYYSAPESEQTEEDLYETIYTKMKINDDYSYKLLSITKKEYK